MRNQIFILGLLTIILSGCVADKTNKESGNLNVPTWAIGKWVGDGESLTIVSGDIMTSQNVSVYSDSKNSSIVQANSDEVYYIKYYKNTESKAVHIKKVDSTHIQYRKELVGDVNDTTGNPIYLLSKSN